jgi:hypothetical protein
MLCVRLKLFHSITAKITLEPLKFEGRELASFRKLMCQLSSENLRVDVEVVDEGILKATAFTYRFG